MPAIFSLLTRFYSRFYHATPEAEFFISLSHELQTPIAILKSNWEILAGERAGDRAAALKAVGTTTDQMSQLVADFLRAARLDLAYEIPNKEMIQLDELLREVHDDCVSLADNAGVHLMWASGRGNILADRTKLKEVIFNLISNALKHTDAGGAITLSGKMIAPGCEIIVRDTGSGIPAADLPYIFDRYYRIKNDSSAGTGLGLHITSKIIHAHGGTIDVQSEVGEGARFVIFIP